MRILLQWTVFPIFGKDQRRMPTKFLRDSEDAAIITIHYNTQRLCLPSVRPLLSKEYKQQQYENGGRKDGPRDSVPIRSAS